MGFDTLPLTRSDAVDLVSSSTDDSDGSSGESDLPDIEDAETESDPGVRVSSSRVPMDISEEQLAAAFTDGINSVRNNSVLGVGFPSEHPNPSELLSASHVRSPNRSREMFSLQRQMIDNDFRGPTVFRGDYARNVVERAIRSGRPIIATGDVAIREVERALSGQEDPLTAEAAYDLRLSSGLRAEIASSGQERDI